MNQDGYKMTLNSLYGKGKSGTPAIDAVLVVDESNARLEASPQPSTTPKKIICSFNGHCMMYGESVKNACLCAKYINSP